MPAQLKEKIREHRGVGFVCSKKLEKHADRITAHDSNNVTLNIKGAVNIVFHNTHQPHAGEKNEDTKNREYRTIQEIKNHVKKTKQLLHSSRRF